MKITEVERMIDTINRHTSRYRPEPIRQDILDTMSEVSREDFGGSYFDNPESIGHGQTISQPFIVAFMTDILQPSKEHRILEIGTGSGYQTAILSRLVKEVFTVERIEPLAKLAAERLSNGNYGNISYKTADGHDGWEEHAPYDGIIVTATAKTVPRSFEKQLKVGGRLVIPVLETNAGLFRNSERLFLFQKKATPTGYKMVSTPFFGVRFVPLVEQKQA